MTIIFQADKIYHCDICKKDQPGTFILTGNNEIYCRLCAIKYLIHKINDYEDLVAELKK